MLIQNFGVTNKEIYGMLWIFWSGQLFRPITDDMPLIRANIHMNRPDLEQRRKI